jgi:amino acid adenylation domain-containing protein
VQNATEELATIFLASALILEARLVPHGVVTLSGVLNETPFSLRLSSEQELSSTDVLLDVKQQLSSAGIRLAELATNDDAETSNGSSNLFLTSPEWARTYRFDCPSGGRVEAPEREALILTKRLGLIADALRTGASSAIAEIDICLAGERERIAAFSLNGDTREGIAPNLLSLFKEQVSRNPERIAILDALGSMTFAELWYAVALASDSLRHHNVGQGSVVGVCAPRSRELVIAALGVLYAGGCYLPLDPSLPLKRRQFIVEDAGAKIIITSGNPSSEVFVGAQVLDLKVTTHGDIDPACGIGTARQPDWPCYIIYTSGSTGTPKGVAVSDQQVLNRYRWLWSTFPFDNHDVFAVKSAPGFVDSFWEIVGTLTGGCTIAIISDEEAIDPRRFAGAIERFSVTRIWLVPTLLKRMLELDDVARRQLESVSHWVSTGEPLLSGLRRRFADRLPKAGLHNLYGSSEFGDLCWTMPRPNAEEKALTTVGYPISNVRCHIIDRFNEICPVEVWGELVVAPEGLPKGFIGREDLDAKTFLILPTHDKGPVRFGRTGDICRWLNDGELELLGRVDTQIKIRGARVDYLEVESVLAANPLIREAIVYPTHDDFGDVALTAVISPSDIGATFDGNRLAGELRRQLRTQLPSFAIPHRFVVQEELPKTQSGKLDRRLIFNSLSRNLT